MHILHIDCSPRDPSHSRQMSAALVGQLRAHHPSACITRRDLGREPVAHAQAGYAWALSSPASMADAVPAVLQGSEQLIREVEAADALVIGTPMHNFTVPSVLKAWIDQILRVGRTMGVAPSGEKIGLLRDRPVYIAIASGGVFSGQRARQPDFLMPYLQAAFGCVGLASLQFFALQATAFLDEAQLAAERLALVQKMEIPPRSSKAQGPACAAR